MGLFTVVGITSVTDGGTIPSTLLTEVTGDFAPCEQTMLVAPVENSVITMSYGSGEEGDGTFTIGTTQDEVVQEIVNYSLGAPTYDGGLATLRCSNRADDLNYSVDSTHYSDDLYLFDTTFVNEWELDYIMELPIAKYASGIHGTKIYFFGGCRDTGWAGINQLYSYDTETKELEDLGVGPNAKADCYGWVDGDSFYVYGGYAQSLSTPTFISEFHRYSITGKTWHSLPIPGQRITNKIIGGHGRLYISNAMEALSGVQGWAPLYRTYEYDIGGGWSSPYAMDDYTPVEWFNFESFIYHKGTIYYYNEGSLMQILPDQSETTVGVPFPGHNPKMASYGDYIIFSHGVTDGATSTILETSWYNPDNRTYGTFAITGYIPEVVIGMDIWVIGGWLYMVGGIPEVGTFSNKIWKLNLKEFFKCLNGDAPKIDPDTYRVSTIGACKEFAGHPCGTTRGVYDGTYVRDYNDPFHPDYIPS